VTMRRTISCILAVLLLASCGSGAHAKSKDLLWQTGTLVDSSTERGSRILTDGDDRVEVSS
jgi:hypothetical protein